MSFVGSKFWITNYKFTIVVENISNMETLYITEIGENFLWQCFDTFLK